MRNKSFAVGIIIGALLTMSISIAADLSEDVRIYYSVKDIKIDYVSKMPEQKPFILNGTTYVPLRYLSETIGYSVGWDAETQTVYLNSPGVDVITSPTLPKQGKDHYIDMEIFQFGYEPSLIEVNQGDTIHLTLTASDVAHGFRLDEYDINVKLEAGESKTLLIEADKKGVFEFDCSVFCGTGHGIMSGNLVVK